MTLNQLVAECSFSTPGAPFIQTYRELAATRDLPSSIRVGVSLLT